MNGSDVSKVSQVAMQMISSLQNRDEASQTVQITNGTVEIKIRKKENLQESNSKQQLLFG